MTEIQREQTILKLIFKIIMMLPLSVQSKMNHLSISKYGSLINQMIHMIVMIQVILIYYNCIGIDEIPNEDKKFLNSIIIS